MFTGIVQKLVKVESIDKQANLIRLGLGLGDLAKGLELGASVAINGVCTTAPLVSLVHEDHDRVYTFEVVESWMKFIFHKGFVAVDGASLTVSAVDRANLTFSVSLIPETIARTTLGLIELGDQVNIEVEAQTVSIVETVERVMAER